MRRLARVRRIEHYIYYSDVGSLGTSKLGTYQLGDRLDTVSMDNIVLRVL